ncbi:tau-tubulin kinase 2 [Stylonychia lemnae]|uniref:Tau-tubulin kinase 2 n=1 Tax=Stylonychia lemnae TaxID=5949 RepID=A0A078AE96_STYLE|nr:tau-tubulin kinase 2 [Stylonychia lemnae]|eukprot:CDW80520.1 tau-tubulin kinase 2 [Stylonychia lemnae]
MQVEPQSIILPQIVGEYKFVREIGKGAYGVVGQYMKDNDSVAIKFEILMINNSLLQEKINLMKMNQAFEKQRNDDKNIYDLNHEERRFTKIVNGKQVKFDDGKSYQCLIMEFFEQSLQTYYDQNKSDDNFKKIAREIISSLKQIHNK